MKRIRSRNTYWMISFPSYSRNFLENSKKFPKKKIPIGVNELASVSSKDGFFNKFLPNVISI